MNEEMQALSEKLDRLRIDLTATNLALSAIAAALPREQLQDVLATLAKASVQKQATFERIPVPAMKAVLQQQLEAEDRIYQALQGAAKMFGKG